MRVNLAITLQFILCAVIGSVVACSPTKFGQSQTATTLCDSSVTTCTVQNQSIDITQPFKIGSGKVDILFVSDNSASMSDIQKELAARFAGFIQILDAKSIDYRIAITTTDLTSVQQKPLIQYGNGRYYLTNADANRVQLFNQSIVRSETLTCENFIIGMFNAYGNAFQSHTDYVNNYSRLCPASDTRGIYTAHLVVSSNSSSFMRADANLNVIAISNDNVRQGQAKDTNDTAAAFSSMMQNNYPSKYWDFNSIIVKDNTCKQQQTLRNASGTVVTNPYGPAISGGVGLEYINLSNSAAKDIENVARPRGQVLDICESNYTSHFTSMATQISEESRMITLKCTPTVAPVVSGSVPHTWSGNRIIFQRGYEGTQVSVTYSCYTGPT